MKICGSPPNRKKKSFKIKNKSHEIPNHQFKPLMSPCFHLPTDKGQSLEGKRCLVTGSNYVSLAVAEKLLELGAIPLTVSDTTGHIYEPMGFDAAKLKVIQKIKSDRGAKVGRYIIASTSAKFNEPANIYDIKCDMVFACSNIKSLDANDVSRLAASGCTSIIEGVHQAMGLDAIAAAKKKGFFLGPYRATTVGAALINGMTLANEPLQIHAGETIDSRIEAGMSDVFHEITSTAKEFNTRGDLHAGANIAAFLRVADAMLAHGSV